MSAFPNIAADAALELLSAGFCPIPIPLGSKAPIHPGWQNQRVTADAVPQVFPTDSNIGVLLGEAGNGRADVDCDCPEAIALAPAFLPATGFIHGRTSRPRSHYHYIGAPVPTHRKYEFGGECLLELRTVGQTVVPPSIHPSGEQLTWDAADGVPPTVTGGALSAAVGELAAATLIVRHYPHVGSRHDFSLALAGFLLRQGWIEDRACRFVVAVATVAGDDEIEDRTHAVETTSARLVSGEKAVGGLRLRETLGGAAFDKFCEWLGFAKTVRFEFPTVEADNVAPDVIPAWPAATLEGDYITELTYLLTKGTPIPPQFVREQVVLVLAALADGHLGFPRHLDLPMRRFLALVSEYPQSGKGESWKRITETSNGALRPLLDDELKLLNGSGIGSGQFLAKELQENPRAVCHWDEASQLFQVTGQQSCTLFSALKSLFESTSHWTGSFTNKKYGGDNLHLSVAMHSTTRTFVDGFSLRGGIGDGLLSRFTLAYAAGMSVITEWEPRDFSAEKHVVDILTGMLPQHTAVPTIADDARECMAEFARKILGPDFTHPFHVRRLPELAKVDLLHRCVYSGSLLITREMAERSVQWAEHQLALRIALWPPDAGDKTAAMTQVLMRRLEKGSASANDLRRAANVDRNGTHELFNRCLLALTRSRTAKTVGKNSKGFEIYAIADDGVQP